MAKRKTRGIRQLGPCCFEINYQVNGVRKQYQVAAKSMAEARIIREEHRVDFRKKLFMPQNITNRSNATFEEAWERLYENVISEDFIKKTELHYKRTYWRMFGEFREKYFPNITSMNQLSIPFFVEYKSYYSNKLSKAKGFRAELIFVKAIMRRLYLLGFCDRELIERLKEIKSSKSPKKEYPYIQNYKIKKLLEYVRNDRIDYYYPIYFIFRTGRRINETTLIERKDVVWQGIKPLKINIRAETTKMKAYAPLEKLDSGLEQVIKEANRMSQNKRSKYLFCNKKGRQCTSGRVRDYLVKVSKKVIGERLTPHYFRHRFLTECGKAQVPIVDIMAIAGIKDIDVVVRHYSHSTEEGLNKVLGITEV